MAEKQKRQPKDPFNGAGDWNPKAKRARKPKPQPVAAAPLVATLADIRSAAEGTLARMDVLDMVTIRQDLQWIIQLADAGLKVG